VPGTGSGGVTATACGADGMVATGKATTTTASATDSVGAAPQRYYRILLLPQS